MPKRVRPALHSLRGIALIIFLMVGYALERSRAGAMLVTGALFTGATLIGVGLLFDIPALLLLLLLGIGALLGEIGLASYRQRAGWAIAAVACGLAVAVLPRVFSWVYDAIDGNEHGAAGVIDVTERLEPVSVAAGLVLAAAVLGRVSVEWPKPAVARDAEHLSAHQAQTTQPDQPYT